MPTRKHIVIVDPASHTAELESFNRLVTKHPQLFTYHLPKMMGMSSLLNMESPIDAIVVLGSSCSVHDAEPWQKDFNLWLSKHIQKDIPILGICYGHQLLAHLEGAKVAFVFDKEVKRKGLYEVNIRTSDFTKSHLGRFIFSHNEAVVDLGSNWLELGHSNELRNEFIKHRTKPLWGIQAHPESSFTFGKNSGLVENLNESDLVDGHNFLDSFIHFISR